MENERRILIVHIVVCTVYGLRPRKSCDDRKKKKGIIREVTVDAGGSLTCKGIKIDKDRISKINYLNFSRKEVEGI
ncbi:hypothetical protein EUGRSUZ_K00856 [Eucalyptus grandis]|uniref:Uncharacterized protein n=2 Tax=Eucalyptus grandis TaxID=71139 RepID=A0ACC3IT30_EUCGR|nr:hypothetical protein EUGRSUZ_K00856 [Eucalyptus grandis]